MTTHAVLNVDAGITVQGWAKMPHRAKPVLCGLKSHGYLISSPGATPHAMTLSFENTLGQSMEIVVTDSKTIRTIQEACQRVLERQPAAQPDARNVSP